MYIWADGIYLKAGLGTEKACLMVLIGADTNGQKHLIALREGFRERAERRVVTRNAGQIMVWLPPGGSP